MSILWSSVTSYSLAFFRCLVRNEGWDIQLVYQPGKINTQYDNFDFSFLNRALQDSKKNRQTIDSLVWQYRPDVVVISGWGFYHYVRIARKLRKKGTYVVASMDNQWAGTARQRLGAVMSPFVIKPSVDNFLVAGDRQAEFARRLGYNEVMYGLYSADVDQFDHQLPITERERNFLFVGRLISEKGVDLLKEGYCQYREKSKYPWGLNIVGTGPLKVQFDDVSGIKCFGFVQPRDLPKVYATARCFVLPSRLEPWGVVIHEATAAGLPIIASHACGAITRFVQEGVNGMIIPNSATAVGMSMASIAGKSEETLEEMSLNSRKLAEMWTPKKLARYFSEQLKEIRRF